MTTDNDQAAVDALCMLTYTSDQEGEPHDCVEGADAARAILDAIRAGQVPGVFIDDTPATDDYRTKPGWLKRERDELLAEVERLEALVERSCEIAHAMEAARDRQIDRADKATAERDRLAGLLKESYSCVHHVMSRQTSDDRASYRDLIQRIDAALAEVGK